jgi:hypothetical protein
MARETLQRLCAVNLLTTTEHADVQSCRINLRLTFAASSTTGQVKKFIDKGVNIPHIVRASAGDASAAEVL